MSISVYSVEGLANWLETQPAEESYSYVSGTDCLIARYIKSRTGSEVYIPVEKLHDWGFYNIANVGGDRSKETYGAALKRARKQLAVA